MTGGYDFRTWFVKSMYKIHSFENKPNYPACPLLYMQIWPVLVTGK